MPPRQIASDTQVTAERLEGHWVGHLSIAERVFLVTLRLERSEGGARGVAYLPNSPEFMYERAPLTSVSGEQPGRFIAEHSATRFDFDLRFEADGALVGDVRADALPRSGLVRVRRLAPLKDDDYTALVGTYEIQGGGRLLLARGAIGGLIAYDSRFPLGATRLFPTTPSRFEHPVYGKEQPDVIATFRRNSGSALRVTLQRKGSKDFIATRSEATRHEEIQFAGGAGQLAGTLLTPAGPGPFPCVIFTHGSGPQERDLPSSLSQVDAFLQRGIAAFLYDKCGTGQSHGNWRRASLQDLASDAVAAGKMLRSHSRIDAARVGVIGGSQGGWIVPLALSQSPELAFGVALATAGVSPREQEMYRMRGAWKDDGLSEEERAQLERLWTLCFEALVTGRGREAYELARRNATGAPVLARLPPPLDEPSYALLGYGFDPLPVWRTVRQPVLILNGDADAVVPARESLRLIADALRENGHRRNELDLIPGADHGLLIYNPRPAYAPGILDRIAAWVESVTASARD
jgi:uncharacterized protein